MSVVSKTGRRGKKVEKIRKTKMKYVPIKPTSTFEEVLHQLNTFYNVSDGKALKVGLQSGPDVTTFNSRDFGTYVSETV